MSNKISATIVADSINPFGDRITTFELVYPRFIHSEILTHRMFSKNSASSRAIPFKKMMKSIMDEPFVPIAFQREHPGMQGTEYLDNVQHQFAVDSWLQMRDDAVRNAQVFNSNGITKQLCNRITEPFMYIKVLLTATEFDNFFSLRCPVYMDCEGVHRSRKDYIKNGHYSEYEDFSQWTDLDWLKLNEGMAEIHLMDLAEKMWDALGSSVPIQLKETEWHIPYIHKIAETIHASEIYEVALARNDGDGFTQPQLVNASNEIVREVATMMCARTSYTTIDADDSVWTLEKYLKKYAEMKANKHWSPFEHVSQVPTKKEYYANVRGTVNVHPQFSGAYRIEDTAPDNISGWFDNYKGWKQLRRLVSL